MYSIPVSFHVYYYNSNSVSEKYADKYAKSTIESYGYLRRIIETQKLPHYCFCNMCGQIFVGINSFALMAVNRKWDKNIINAFLSHPNIKECLWKILLMKKSDLGYADISKRNKVSAIWYILKKPDKALKNEEKYLDDEYTFG